jgi:hypothetical protein
VADSQRLQQLAAAPAGPVKGTVYFDTVLNALGIYDGTVWVYGSKTAWGPSGGTTEIDGNLTLGGKPVSAVPPTSGGPYYLEWNGTDWVAGTVSGGGAVSSVFTRTGAVVATSGDYTVAQVTGAAPLASPALTGVPTVPTATALTDDTQAASTAYADAAVGVEKTRAEAAEVLKLPLAGGTMSGAIAMGAEKITGLANGSAGTDAAAFGQIPTVPTEIDGNLTLGGKPVSAVPPTSGGPYYLEWNGTDWVAEDIAGEIDGNLTLGGKPVSASSPVTGSVLTWNGTDWVAKAPVGYGGFNAGLSTDMTTSTTPAVVTNTHTALGAVPGGWGITGNAQSWFVSATGYFTPQVAGYYLIFGVVGFSTEGDQGLFLTDIFKNGSLYQRIAYGGASGSNGGGDSGVVLAHANGSTDYFQLGYYGASQLQALTTYWGAALLIPD